MSLEVLRFFSELLELGASIEQRVQVCFHICDDLIEMLLNQAKFATRALFLLIGCLFVKPDFRGRLLHFESQVFAQLTALQALGIVLEFSAQDSLIVIEL